MKIKEAGKSSKLTLILLIIYMLMTVWIILFKLQFPIAVRPERSINLIPFFYGNNPNTGLQFRESLANILIFIPVGIYMTMLTVKPVITILSGLGFSFLLEITQYVFSVGVADVTDLLTNTSGTLIGVLICLALIKFSRDDEKLNRTLNALAIVCTTVVFILILCFMVL